MKVLLTTLNAKYIHKNLAIRWLYVAADKKHDTYFKEYTIKDDLGKIADEISEKQYDVVGLSTYIWNGEYIKKLIPMIKKKLPNCRIVIGGPEVSYKYDDYLLEETDAIILGEGEKVFWDYVNEKTNIPGLITHDYCNKTINKVDVAYLETLDSPYLLSCDLQDMDKHYLYVEASRGCPYQCGYCLASLDNKIREFSNEYLFELFDQLEKTKVKQIKFLDRTFNADSQRSYLIAKRLMSFRNDCSFQFEIMADTLSQDLIDLINSNPHKNKFRFEVGIQSFNQEALKEVRRYQNLDKLKNNVTSLLANGAIVHADLIAGLPYERLDSFKQTYQKLFALKVDEMQVGILKLLKGSRLEKEMDKYHIICHHESPYQIISNDWIDENDINSVEKVALTTERLYNRDLCKQTLIYLFDHGYFMYDLMEKMGNRISLLLRPYQPHQIFKIVDDCIDDKQAKLILKNEYYYNFKQRPVRYCENDIERENKNLIFQCLVNEDLLTRNDIRYAYFDYGYYKKDKVYQILIYNSDQKYPMRYFVSLDYKYLGKGDLNERHHDCYWQ